MAASNAKIKAELRNLTTEDEDKLVVTGFEKQARQLRSRKNEIEELDDIQKIELIDFRAAIADERMAAEKKGQFYKTCSVSAGRNHEPVIVTFKDAYKKLRNAKQEETLKRAFGKHYDNFFSKQVEMKINDGVDVETLREALGPRAYAALEKHVKISEYVKVKGSLMEARSHLRSTAEAVTNERLDIVMSAIQQEPQVRLNP